MCLWSVVMRNVERALWFIERELTSHLDLGEVSRDCKISPFTLSRLFTVSTDWPVMKYVRARRLSQAAQSLRQGAPDILQVALEAGYGSHEAFTRAFSELFGITPKQARETDHDLLLVEPFRMKEMKTVIV
jgi:AraC family transcriptional regulator